MKAMAKATKKIILEFYQEMNDALDNLSFGIIDQHHPKIIKRHKYAAKRKWVFWKAAMTAYIGNNDYFVKGNYFGGKR